MYIPISKEAPVLGMRPSDTRRPLERERERETTGLAKWCQCSLSLTGDWCPPAAPAAVSMIQSGVIITSPTSSVQPVSPVPGN